MTTKSGAGANWRQYALAIRGERHFRVNDDGLASRDAHDQVRALQVTLGRPRGGLHREVAVLEQPGALDDVAQLRLAPSAADVRRAKRVCKRAGSFREQLDLLPKRAVGLRASPVGLLHRRVDALERLLQRRHGRGQL